MSYNKNPQKASYKAIWFPGAVESIDLPLQETDKFLCAKLWHDCWPVSTLMDGMFSMQFI